MSGKKRFRIIILSFLIIVAAGCAFFFIIQAVFEQRTITTVSGMNHEAELDRPVIKDMITVTVGDSIDVVNFFVEGYNSAVSPYYADYPDFYSLGLQPVSIKIPGVDELFESKLFIVKPKDFVLFEAQTGSPALHPEDFLENTDSELTGAAVSFISDINKVDFTTASDTFIEIKVNDITVYSSVKVVDTTPPEAEAVNVKIFNNEIVYADAFVTNVNDLSDVSASFFTEPDFNFYGDQDVSVILRDAYGNETAFTSVLTIEFDDVPPVIGGVVDISIFIGNSISYRKGVTVTDDKDLSPELTIDSSAVDRNTAGIYTVTYTATDKAKNSSSVTANVTVNPIKEEDVFQMADDVLANIITPSMAPVEVARKIFNWVTNSIAYTSSSDKSNVINGAYLGFTNRFGDCYVYYAVSELLLNRAGIENIPVTRVGGRSRHYWSLINIGTGWHHFDSCRKSIPWDSFMMTDNSAEAYSKIAGNNYYTYDKTLYPEVVAGEKVTYTPRPRTEPIPEFPPDEVPTQEAPMEETPTQEAPTEETPTQEAPMEETPTQEAPTEETPTQEAPTEETPTQEAPTEETPTQEAPTEETPTQEAPAEETPIILDPAETAPIVVIPLPGIQQEQQESPQP